VVDGDSLELVHTAEAGVVEVDLHLRRTAEAVGASRTEPVGAERLHHLIGVGEVAYIEVLLGEEIAVNL
jgi:hypothetical protein